MESGTSKVRPQVVWLPDSMLYLSRCGLLVPRASTFCTGTALSASLDAPSDPLFSMCGPLGQRRKQELGGGSPTQLSLDAVMLAAVPEARDFPPVPI
jgi:hypothetical protein